MGTWLMLTSLTITVAACTLTAITIRHIWNHYTETLEDLEDYRIENALLWEQNRTLKRTLGDTTQ
jgi:hypothetical protein